MVVRLSTEYSVEEREFLEAHGCGVLSEIRLPNYFDCETPRRMFVYGGAYIGEIEDEDGIVWAVLSKFKGKFRWGECYSDLNALEEGL